MNLRTLLLACSSIAMAGCMSTSPNPAPAPKVSAGQVVTMAAGTAGGALIGDAIGGKKGAIIGGAAGLVTSAVASNILADRKNQEIEEAKEQARREERVKVMQAYWKEKAIDAERQEGREKEKQGASTKTRLVEYPAGTYDGVEYAPRVKASPAP